MLVVGQCNFKQDNPCEKYRKCGTAIKLCLNITQAAREKHIEKRNAVYEYLPEWWIEFHVENCKVGEPGKVVQEKKILQLLTGAEFGLSADHNFEKGQMIGMYLGGKTGMPGYTMKPR